MLTIHGIPQSNFVWAARLGAAKKGVQHDNVPDMPHDGAASAHPLGKIPVMRHGDVTVFESRAIVDYIDAVFDGPPLKPREPRAAAGAEAWASMVITGIEPPLIREHLFAHLFPGTADGSPDTRRIDAVRGKVDRCLTVLEEGSKAGAVCADEYTLADLWAAPILLSLARTPGWDERLKPYPRVAEATGRYAERPGVRATMPA